MQKGNINVQAENVFPIIKKFLYSDQEIFLRELISNAVDATQKLKTLSSVNEFKGDLGDLKIEVKVDKDKKTITISDKGIGMTAEEVDKYINQIAFSGAQEFVDKYKNKTEAIIGHFGLGFYSAYMVADRVEIISLSYKNDAVAIKWECDGSTEYTIEETEKDSRGTDIVLHISDEAKDYLEESKINQLLTKYAKFLPVPIKFGTKDKYDEKGEKIDEKEDVIINNTNPAWTKKPVDLKDEDYKNFYNELYPFSEEPLFNIHLNVDYPFNLTGILYFPKIKNNIEIQKNKIQLYCNQVFVTDQVENIVPEFLTLLHGVIDSPDIPLNVSRSYLQSDSNVKKISNHIMKKVSDRLEEIFKNNREDFEQKWDNIKLFIQYGMLTEEKFYERAVKFALFKNISGKYFTYDEYKEKIEKIQTDKEKQLIYLYTTNKEEQFTFIEAAREKGYDVIEMDGHLDNHFINHLEQKLENCSFVRVDADTIDKLIKKEEPIPSKLSETETDELRVVFQGQVDNNFTVVFESLSETDLPIIITQPEFMRRMKDMSKLGNSGFMGMGNFPDMYNIAVNSNHALIGELNEDKNKSTKKEVLKINEKISELEKSLEPLKKDDKLKEQNKEEIKKIEDSIREDRNKKEEILKGYGKDNKIVKQLIDLALLSQNMLKGEALNSFVKRSIDLIKK